MGKEQHFIDMKGAEFLLPLKYSDLILTKILSQIYINSCLMGIKIFKYLLKNLSKQLTLFHKRINIPPLEVQ